MRSHHCAWFKSWRAQQDKDLEQYTNLLNGNRLELVDFLFFTLLVERKFNKRNNFYAANDTTTRDWPWAELWLNTQDIGAFGRFWILERSFENCDICQEEWESPEATKH
uniref:Glutathione S-transferase n=1 Tax=Globodera rostochiensis TaxID=31243 RepID=A0A914HIS1_GLORO